MATPEEIRAELRAEERDDYRGTPPSYNVHRQGQESVFGFVFYDSARAPRLGLVRDQDWPIPYL